MEPQTAAATAARKLQGQRRRAAELRAAGWVVIEPRDVDELPRRVRDGVQRFTFAPDIDARDAGAQAHSTRQTY